MTELGMEEWIVREEDFLEEEESCKLRFER